MQEKTGFKKLTKEEIGYLPTDKVAKMWLLNPHDHHFLYQRSDGSFYGYSNIKSEGGNDYSLGEAVKEMGGKAYSVKDWTDTRTILLGMHQRHIDDIVVK